jgi:penicillin-binding protein 1A
LKAPSRYNPVSDFSAARKRSAIVLKRMFVTGFITKAEYEHALSFGFAVKSESQKYGGGYIADEIRSLTPKILGEKAYNALTANSDAVVLTTIDNLLQEAATLTIESYLKVNAERIGLSQAAFVAINDEGAVIAMSGGADYNHSQFNRATQALRQPGSAFKPFVYAAAIEKGDFDPDDTIEDAPIRIGNFTPQNYTGKYRGEMSLRSAFAYSANTPAVRLAQYAGLNEVAQLAQRAGIKTPLEKNMALALGASEVNLLELTAAYLPFFNGGTRVDPFFIRNIYEQDGRLIYENKAERGERVISPLTAQRMRELLYATVDYGTGTKAKLKTGLPVFGKTGTASDYRDAWFVGRVGGRSGITAGVWLGNDNSAPGKEEATGGASAAKLWKGVFDVYLDAAPKNIALLQKNPTSYYQTPRQSPARAATTQPATTQPKQSAGVQAPAKKTEPDDYNPSRIEELLLKLGQ